MEITQEQQQYLVTLNNFGESLRKIMPPEKVVDTLEKLSVLVVENPAMIQDLSSFENWGGLQKVAEKIGSDLTKGGKKPGIMDFMSIIPKIKKELEKQKVV
jgi:hypothetical protein